MGVRMILSYQIISDWPVLINPELSPILILGFETIDRHGNKQACTFETSKPTLKILASFASSRFKLTFFQETHLWLISKEAETPVKSIPLDQSTWRGPGRDAISIYSLH